MNRVALYALLVTWLVASGCAEPAPTPVADLTDEELLYQQALTSLPDLPEIERQVVRYRRQLVVERYLQQMLQSHVEAVSEADCRTYYDQDPKLLRLRSPIVKGLLVKLPATTRHASQLRDWMRQLSMGKTDCMADLDAYCQQRGVLYDTFLNQWADLSRLTDPLPVTVVDSHQFLAIKSYELSDDEYLYLFVVTDYRLAGEVQPFEYALPAIRNELMQQRRTAFRHQLIKALRQQQETTRPKTTDNR